MSISRNQKILLSIFVAVIILGFYFVIDRRSKNTGEDLANTNQIKQATSTESVATGRSSYTIEQIPIINLSVPKMPDLSKPIYINPSLGLSESSKTIISNKIEEYRKTLKSAPASLDVWIELGIYQKMAGDFLGAAETWKYASQISPTDYVSLGNLGNLYSYFLSDPKTAESYYQAAIKNGPTQSYLYVQFAEMYRDIEKNRAEALAVVQSGLAKIPDDQNLIRLQNDLMKK